MADLSQVLADLTRAQSPEAGLLIEPSATGRSTLLRAGIVSAGRPRGLASRRVFVAAVLGGQGLAIWALAYRWLGTGGLMYPIYFLHDAVWLPLQGRFWVATFPFGLIWAAPMLALTVAIMVEFLGLAGPVRRSQTAVIEALLTWGGASFLVWAHAVGRVIGLPAVQVHAVVGEKLRQERRDVLHAVDGGAKPDLRRLLALQVLDLRLGETVPGDMLRGFEVLALAQLLGQSDQAGVRHLERVLVAKSPEAELEPYVRAFAKTGKPASEAAVLAAANWLATAKPDPVRVAIATLIVALAGAESGSPLILQWFDVWATVRSGKATAGSAVWAAAEGSISFEFWAARADSAIRQGRPDELLLEVFGQPLGTRPHGEVAAHFGVTT